MSLTLERNGQRLCLGMLPDRKKPCLYFWNAMEIRIVASFQDEDSMKMVEDFLEAGAHDGARLTWAPESGKGGE